MTPPALTLHGFWRSTATWRVRIGLRHKGLDYTYQPLDLRRAEQHTEAYRAVNPIGQVPTLELEESGHRIRLTQSMAILEYLEEAYPEPALLPREPLLRAHARRLAEIVNSGIQPLQNTSVQAHVRDELHADDRAWTRFWVTRGLGPLEAGAAASAGRFAVGDAVTFADVFIVPEMYFARRFEVDLSPYPALRRIEAACADLSAFQAAHAEAQPDWDGTKLGGVPS